MSSALHFLYQTKPGRCALRVLTRPSLSKAAGRFLDSPLSRPLIRPFVRHAGIRTEDFLTDGVRSFNDFFHREIKADKRPVDMRPESLIAPCDGLLRAFRIKDGTVLPVKESRYTIPALLRNASLAARYKDGVCLVFRLSVSHYHRYAYIESGTKSPDRSIPGVLHTVQPIALREVPGRSASARSCRWRSARCSSAGSKTTRRKKPASRAGRKKAGFLTGAPRSSSSSKKTGRT